MINIKISASPRCCASCCNWAISIKFNDGWKARTQSRISFDPGQSARNKTLSKGAFFFPNYHRKTNMTMENQPVEDVSRWWFSIVMLVFWGVCDCIYSWPRNSSHLVAKHQSGHLWTVACENDHQVLSIVLQAHEESTDQSGSFRINKDQTCA